MMNIYSAQPLLQASLKLKSFGSDLRMPMDVVCEGEKKLSAIVRT